MRQFLRCDFQAILVLPGRTEILLCHLQREAAAGESEHAFLPTPVDAAGTVPGEMNGGAAHDVSGVGDESHSLLFALECLPRFRQITGEVSGESRRRFLIGAR